MTPQEVLKTPETFSTTALILLVDSFGTEFFEWDPVTVNMEIASTFGIEPSSELTDRINAATSLFTSNLFQVSLETFSACCNAFNFGSVTSELFMPADLDDVLWGVTEANVLAGDMLDPEGYSHNVSRYVGYILAEGGFQKAPSMLAFAEFDEEEAGRSYDDVTGDSEGYKTYWDLQEDEKNGLETTNNHKILALFKQINRLELQNGSTAFIEKMLEKTKGMVAPTE